MISVSSLTRYYGAHPAVEDVSFSIADKEVVGFLGLNGAGKSTTLKVLAGLLMPTAGQVRIDVWMFSTPRTHFGNESGFFQRTPRSIERCRLQNFYGGSAKSKASASLRCKPDFLRFLNSAS